MLWTRNTQSYTSRRAILSLFHAAGQVFARHKALCHVIGSQAFLDLAAFGRWVISPRVYLPARTNDRVQLLSLGQRT